MNTELRNQRQKVIDFRTARLLENRLEMSSQFFRNSHNRTTRSVPLLTVLSWLQTPEVNLPKHCTPKNAGEIDRFRKARLL